MVGLRRNEFFLAGKLFGVGIDLIRTVGLETRYPMAPWISEGATHHLSALLDELRHHLTRPFPLLRFLLR
jgi:hypothetical protein